MESSHLTEMVEVLNKKGDIVFRGVARSAIEWVILNPLEGYKVKLEGTKEPMPVDDWLREFDKLNDL